MRLVSRLRIRYRFLAGSTLLVLLVSVFVGVYYPARQTAETREEQRVQARSLAEMVALGVGVGLGLSELSVVQSTYDWARQDPSLFFVTVVDLGGVELGTWTASGQDLDLIAPPVDGETRLVERPHEIQVATPVVFQEQPLGTLWLGLDLAPMYAEIAAQRRQGLLVSLLVLVLGSVFSLLLAGEIVRPIEQLTVAADRIAAGEHDTPLDIRGSGEIGALADAFRSMVSQLRSSLSELALQAEELAGARDTALEATRAKSDFLATMSHEIRTPMNGVLGMLELLQGQEMDAEARGYATVAYSSAEALLAIINDILDFSKIEAGKLEIEQIDFELHSMVEEVCALLANRAEVKGVELVCSVDPKAPHSVVGDPTRLRQILLNLMGNALKFTEEGEVVVRATVVGDDGTGVELRFEVEDTGLGISEEAQARLFQAFAQADTSTTRRFGGTGLGLAICRRLVEAMRGDIGVRSRAGEGSTFWFTCRLGISDARPDSGRVDTLHGRTVLVVDDNETNRSVLKHQLESWGVRVLLAEDGPAALEVLRDGRQGGEVPDIAILDMEMPGMDGIALGKVMKGDPRYGSIPRILLTSVGTLASTATREAGFTATLAKPVRQAALFDCMTKALSPASGATVAKVNAPPRASVGDVPSLKLLLVEDNKVNQLVAMAILGKMGHSVQLAENGEEALVAIEAGPFDAILMDCQMPIMDGFQATAAIREREEKDGAERRNIIIAMTANAMEGDRDRCVQAGMDDYIAKPFKANELQTMLGEWVAAGDTES